jgi:hypothetical protein
MTLYYVEVEVEGQTLKFEVPAEEVGGEIQYSGQTVQVLGRITNAADQLAQNIRALSSLMLRTVTTLPSKPKELSVEIGLEFNAEAGVVFTSAAVGGSLKLTLTWERESVTDQPQKLLSA